MSISDRLLGKKPASNKPHIEAVAPTLALPGAEVRISGKGLQPPELRRPSVRFGEAQGSVVISCDDFMIARVPEEASSGPVVVGTNGHSSNAQAIKVATLISEDLHPVTNPAIDREGNLYVTFSGQRGQKVPVAIFKIDAEHKVTPFLSDMMNATAIAFDRGGKMYVSSRHDEAIYNVSQSGTVTSYAEGMGVATGIAFDRHQNLYVGDRSGTIFKIAPDRQIFVFATLEPSVSAYHLAISPSGDLFVTGPTTSSFDNVYRIDPHGSVSVFYRGLGRPQGLAFDVEGNMYVAASMAGKRGIVKITPDGAASLEVAGSGLVGLAFAPGKSAVLATNSAVYSIPWNTTGLVLPPD